jgi:hypothetical protein
MVSHYEKIVKMCQFYSDSSRFFCDQLYILAMYPFSLKAMAAKSKFSLYLQKILI